MFSKFQKLPVSRNWFLKTYVSIINPLILLAPCDYRKNFDIANCFNCCSPRRDKLTKALPLDPNPESARDQSVKDISLFNWLLISLIISLILGTNMVTMFICLSIFLLVLVCYISYISVSISKIAPKHCVNRVLERHLLESYELDFWSPQVPDNQITGLG